MSAMSTFPLPIASTEAVTHNWMTQVFVANSDLILSHIETDKDKGDTDREKGDRDIETEADRQFPIYRVTGHTGLRTSFCYHSVFHFFTLSLLCLHSAALSVY